MARCKTVQLFIFIVIFSLVTIIILMFRLNGDIDENIFILKKNEFDLKLINSNTNQQLFTELNNQSKKKEENEKSRVTQKVVKRDKRLGRLYGGLSHLKIQYSDNEPPSKIIYKTEDSVSEVQLTENDCLPLKLPNPNFLHHHHPQKLTPSLPPILICVHPMNLDAYISFELQRDGIWEKEMVARFMALLSSDPEMGVYDIGAHIGLYSLIGASMGRRVVAVEPLKSNVIRLLQAVKANNLEDKITIVQNAILNYRTTLEMNVPLDNQGGSKLSSLDADKYCDDAFNCPPHAETILLNDLLDVSNCKTALLKIDVEGMEHKAMRISRSLFREVEVMYVMMEWREVRKYYGSYENKSEDKTYVNEMIEMMVRRGYVVECVLTGKKLSVEHWYGWPDNVLWVLNK